VRPADLSRLVQTKIVDGPILRAQVMTDDTDKLEPLLAYVSEKGRVCPMPQYWDGLWKLLPHKRRKPKGGFEPPLPLILGGWVASDQDKSERLRVHIRYAAQHGVLKEVDEFLRKIPEHEWYCG
jgi:hypothetical protein